MLIGNKEFDFENKRYVMGVLNITPDSFYDGGKYTDVKKAILRVEEMIREGVDIVDIGGESSRPGSDKISIEEEKKRILPILKEAYKILYKENIPISIDSYKPEVIKAALDNGASIVNDIYGTNYDEDVVSIIKNYKVPIIIMHMQGTPANMQSNPYYDDVVSEIKLFFSNMINKLKVSGIDENSIIIDPGIGFGKRLEDNINIIKNLKHFKTFNRPILIGVSRKSFIGRILDNNPEDRLTGTICANFVSLQNGASILRVHDVKDAVETIKMYEAFMMT